MTHLKTRIIIFLGLFTGDDEQEITSMLSYIKSKGVLSFYRTGDGKIQVAIHKEYTSLLPKDTKGYYFGTEETGYSLHEGNDMRYWDEIFKTEWSIF